MQKDKSKEKDKPQQLVYIFTNPSMQGVIKIGRTDKTIEQRVNDLSRPSGVPDKFECYCCCVVKNNKEIEKRLHYGLKDLRYNNKREFFTLAPERAQMLLVGYARKVLILDRKKFTAPKKNKIPTPKKKNNPVEGSSKKSLFSLLNIKNGATLTFCKDETKIATVIDAEKDKIKFEEDKGSLSGIAQNILGKDALRGPKHWKYKGKILSDMREKIENKNR